MESLNHHDLDMESAFEFSDFYRCLPRRWVPYSYPTMCVTVHLDTSDGSLAAGDDERLREASRRLESPLSVRCPGRHGGDRDTQT